MAPFLELWNAVHACGVAHPAARVAAAWAILILLFVSLWGGVPPEDR